MNFFMIQAKEEGTVFVNLQMVHNFLMNEI